MQGASNLNNYLCKPTRALRSCVRCLGQTASQLVSQLRGQGLICSIGQSVCPPGMGKQIRRYGVSWLSVSWVSWAFCWLADKIISQRRSRLLRPVLVEQSPAQVISPWTSASITALTDQLHPASLMSTLRTQSIGWLAL